MTPRLTCSSCVLPPLVGQNSQPGAQPTTKLHVVVAVCSLTKAVCMAVINGTDVTAICQGLQAVFSRVGVPHGIWTDRQSGLSQITKSGTILTDEDGFKTKDQPKGSIKEIIPHHIRDKRHPAPWTVMDLSI